MKAIWVLIVILNGTNIKEEMYFNDLDSCLEFSKKVQAQNFPQQTAWSEVYVSAYCVPKQVEKDK